MGLESLLQAELFTWVILPLLIFIARIFDVTIGTIRIMFVSRGNKLLAPCLGFFEVFIWLLAIGQIMQNLNNVFCYIAYAGGFATGNFIGIYIEEKMAVGKLVIRIITRRGDSSELIAALRRKGFGATVVDAEGKTGHVNIIFSIINRSDLEQIIAIIQKYNPKAFYSIEDTKLVKEGVFPKQKGLFERTFLRGPKLFRRFRVLRKQRMDRKGK